MSCSLHSTHWVHKITLNYVCLAVLYYVRFYDELKNMYIKFFSPLIAITLIAAMPFIGLCTALAAGGYGVWLWLVDFVDGKYDQCFGRMPLIFRLTERVFFQLPLFLLLRFLILCAFLVAWMAASCLYYPFITIFVLYITFHKLGEKIV